MRRNRERRSPGRARHASGQRRTRHCCVRLSEREWRRIVAWSERAGESAGAFVRASTLGLIAAGGRLPVPATRAGAEERRDLRAIGVLLTVMDAYTNGGRDAQCDVVIAEIQRWIVSRVRGR